MKPVYLYIKNAIKLLVPGNTINLAQNEVVKMMEEQFIKLGLFTQDELDHQDQRSSAVQKILYAQCLSFYRFGRS